MLSISLNGEVTQVTPGLTLQQALQQWSYNQQKCAVAINGEFVPSTRYEETTLQDCDEVDIVAPVGGG